jgi:hypothetical protein
VVVAPDGAVLDVVVLDDAGAVDLVVVDFSVVVVPVIGFVVVVDDDVSAA